MRGAVQVSYTKAAGLLEKALFILENRQVFDDLIELGKHPVGNPDKLFFSLKEILHIHSGVLYLLNTDDNTYHKVCGYGDAFEKTSDYLFTQELTGALPDSGSIPCFTRADLPVFKYGASVSRDEVLSLLAIAPLKDANSNITAYLIIAESDLWSNEIIQDDESLLTILKSQGHGFKAQSGWWKVDEWFLRVLKMLSKDVCLSDSLVNNMQEKNTNDLAIPEVWELISGLDAHFKVVTDQLPRLYCIVIKVSGSGDLFNMQNEISALCQNMIEGIGRSYIVHPYTNIVLFPAKTHINKQLIEFHVMKSLRAGITGSQARCSLIVTIVEYPSEYSGLSGHLNKPGKT